MAEVLRGFRDVPVGCEAIEGEFVFGPMRCHQAATGRVWCMDEYCYIEGRHDHSVCPDHGGPA